MPATTLDATGVPVDQLAPAELDAWRAQFDLAPADLVLDLQRARDAGLNLERLPFGDRQFAFGICCGGLDEVDDPAAVLRELQRTTRRGVIELPHRNSMVTGGCAPAVQWFASQVGGTLVLQRRPFVAHPFGHPATAGAATPWLATFGTSPPVQIYYEDQIPFEVHDDGGYRAALPAERALAHLDLAETLLRRHAGDAAAGLAATEAALALQPQLARAHYVHGQWLWRRGHREQAIAAAQHAARLAPEDAVLLDSALRTWRRAPPDLPAQPHALDLAFWQIHAHASGIDLAALLAPPRRRHPEAQLDAAEVSRFFRVHDRTLSRFVYELPAPWWSRGREYAWAQQFAGPEQVVLDAACGIEHPLKFALAERCRATFACDLDPRLVDDVAVLASVAAAGGTPAEVDRVRTLLPQLDRSLASITGLPHADATFDRVFCISVLEHLLPRDRAEALREFARVVRDSGLVVLTMDHPLVDLAEFERAVELAGLRFCGEVRRHVPPDALGSPDGQLRCYRALLAKA